MPDARQTVKDEKAPKFTLFARRCACRHRLRRVQGGSQGRMAEVDEMCGMDIAKRSVGAELELGIEGRNGRAVLATEDGRRLE